MNRIIKMSRPNRRQARALDKLIADCNEGDGTHYSFPEDADKIYLMYVRSELVAAAALFLMGEEKEGKAIYELAAFTAPKHRRRKYFESLVAAIERKVQGQYIRYAVYHNQAALAVLHHRGAVCEHDELVMKLELAGTAYIYEDDLIEDSTSKDINILNEGGTSLACLEDNKADKDSANQEKTYENIHIDFEAGHVTSSFAECWFRLNADGSEAYIFGVQTFANHLRKGHAFRLLSFLYAALYKRGVKRILLQVSSENTPALKLYEKLGMSITERLGLYHERF